MSVIQNLSRRRKSLKGSEFICWSSAGHAIHTFGEERRESRALGAWLLELSFAFSWLFHGSSIGWWLIKINIQKQMKQILLLLAIMLHFTVYNNQFAIKQQIRLKNVSNQLHIFYFKTSKRVVSRSAWQNDLLSLFYSFTNV